VRNKDSQIHTQPSPWCVGCCGPVLLSTECLWLARSIRHSSILSSIPKPNGRDSVIGRPKTLHYPGLAEIPVEPLSFFLLRTADSLEPASGSKPLLLYVSGPHAAVDAISKRVMALKSVLAKLEHKELRVLDAGHRIEQENRFPGITRLLKFITLFNRGDKCFFLLLATAAVPGFAFNLDSGCL
jgi:hypothetical protein